MLEKIKHWFNKKILPYIISIPSEIIQNYKEILIFSTLLTLAILARLTLIDYQSGDYTIFLVKWWDHINSRGLSNAYSVKFADYSPLYTYFLGLATLFTSQALLGIKIITFLFDFIGAIWLFKLTQKIYPNNRYVAYFLFFLLLFLPSVIMNGALWGQCDIIFTSFLVASLYYLMQNKGFLAIIMFAIAFSFKIQAIFFAPLIVIWAIYNPLKKWWYLFSIPFIYLVTCIPAALQGRSWFDLATIYAQQAGQYGGFNLGLPNFWYFLESNDFKEVSFDTVLVPGRVINVFSMFTTFGVIFGLAVVISLLALIWLYKPNIKQWYWPQFAVLFTLLIPFLLPKMHERYYFAADILSVVLAVVCPKKFWVAVIINLTSFFAYMPFLFGYSLEFVGNEPKYSPVSFWILVLALLAVIVYLIFDLAKDMIKNSQKPFLETNA